MKLLEIKSSLNYFLEKIAWAGRKNLVLWRIENSKKIKEVELAFYQALIKQTSIFLRSEVFKKIKDTIGKDVELIFTEDDERRIKEAVEKHFEPLSEYLPFPILMDFYIWLANQGGQAFIDKSRKKQIKKDAGISFDLKDERTIKELSRSAEFLIEGLDMTTKKWLANQIIKGKREILSQIEIANNIRQKIPETYKYRAETIVRTEMAEIVNRTELLAALKNDATIKIWVAAGMNICPICQENHNQKVGINGTFFSGHDRPPVHPNCKCLLEYEIPNIMHSFWMGE